VDTFWNFLEESRCNLVVGRILLEVDRNKDFLGFGINVAHIDATLVCEEDPIALVRL
jgi:hypothetical protein